MVNPVTGSTVTLQPLGSRSDSPSERLSDILKRRNPDAPTDLPADNLPAPDGPPVQARSAVSTAGFPLLRRRTDRGEPADRTIEIPPHLERRRAWREAFGLNTFHTQDLAQRGEALSPRELRPAAADAYRSITRRGRLDLDLAQLVSMTV